MPKSNKTPNYEVTPSVDFNVDITAQELFDACVQSVWMRRIVPIAVFVGLISLIAR